MDTHNILTFIDTYNRYDKKKNTKMLFPLQYCLYVNIPLDDALFVNNYSTVCTTVKVVSIEYKL